jgi:hypothetical protein
MSTIEIGSPLHVAGVKLLEAAAAYREAYRKQPFPGGSAVVWLDDSAGNTVIFTRGEYRRQLIGNIEFSGVPHEFDHVTTNADMEADFESQTPDGLTHSPPLLTPKPEE